MILAALGWFAAWGLGSAAIFALGWLIVVAVQGQDAAANLATAWFMTFNGVLAGAAGYGVVFFLCRERSTLIKEIQNVIVVPESLQYEFTRRLDLVRSWPRAHYVAALLTTIGGYISYSAGIPLRGFAHLYLSAAVLSFYAVGAYGLMVIIAVLNLFRFLETHADAERDERVTLCAPFRARSMNIIDLFFIISSTMSIFALYVCFRTTLTAFAGGPIVFYKALIIPLFFFLPAALVYSFYPRYVIRQIWDVDTFVAIDRFTAESVVEESTDMKARLELRKLILDVKEKLIAERRALPLLSLKDAPTFAMAILMSIQLVAQKDPIISNFFGLSVK